MSDRILVERIAIYAYHGVMPEEARTGGRFEISLDCALDLRPAGQSDALADTVSYADLVALVTEVATGRRFDLIEALAEAIAAAVLDRFPRLDAATVRVDKPGAPVPAMLGSVAVVVTRSRDG